MARDPEQSYENPKDFERIDEILELISEVWHKNPDLRLCQLIGNCFLLNDLYYIEDDMLQDELINIYLDRKE